MPGCRRRRPISFAWATRLGGWRLIPWANATVSNAAPATPQRRGSVGQLSRLTRWKCDPWSGPSWQRSGIIVPLHCGSDQVCGPERPYSGKRAGELTSGINQEERDRLRDLPAGPGQPVQMPGMRGRALFALYEGAPEESLLAARTAAAGPLPLPGR